MAQEAGTTCPAASAGALAKLIGVEKPIMTSRRLCLAVRVAKCKDPAYLELLQDENERDIKKRKRKEKEETRG